MIQVEEGRRKLLMEVRALEGGIRAGVRPRTGTGTRKVKERRRCGTGWVIPSTVEKGRLCFHRERLVDGLKLFET